MGDLLTRRRIAAAIVALAVLLGAVGIGTALWNSTGPGSSTVAVVNLDDTPSGAGGALATALTHTSGFTWKQLSAPPSGSNYLAVVTIPKDYTASLATLTGQQPKQTTVQLAYGADASTADQQRLRAALRKATDTSATTGVGSVLNRLLGARGQLLNAALVAKVLATTVAGASGQVGDVLNGANEFLPYLTQARDGANQLVAVSGQVSTLINGARGPVNSLADRLTALNVTVGDVQRSNTALSTSVDQLATALTASGIPAPAVTSMLAQVRADLATAHQQTQTLSTTVGAGPDTNVGVAIHNGFNELESVSMQLSSAGAQLSGALGPLAANAPGMFSTIQTQITTAITQLKNASESLSKQLTSGIDSLPNVTGNGQVSPAAALADPILVDDSHRLDRSGARGWFATLFSARNLAILFGCMTLALGAIVLLQRRTTGSHSAP